jgi:hypothetical protein
MMFGVKLVPPQRIILEDSLHYISFGHERIDFTIMSAKSIASVSAP